MTIKMLFCVLAIVAGPLELTAQETTYQVVVSASNPITTLSRTEVSRIFLKRQPTWEHGGSIVAVDLERTSTTRATFTKEVHGRSVTAIGTFWQQQIFAGKQLPPTEKSNDEDVLSHIRSNPNAIGYVSAGAALGNGVKAVTLTH
ncbi:MAG: hypothetical protein WEE89_05685 [Gemmatimonadota bacterium]